MSTPNIAQKAARLMIVGDFRVTAGFRQHLLDAANRAGVSVNEFILTAAGDKLVRMGRDIPGVFRTGDVPLSAEHGPTGSEAA